MITQMCLTSTHTTEQRQTLMHRIAMFEQAPPSAIRDALLDAMRQELAAAEPRLESYDQRKHG